MKPNSMLADAPPPFVLGTMAMTGYYGPSSESQALETLDYYLTQGGRWIDTADLYANGANETLIGKAIAGRRDGVVLCTKFGYLFGERADQRGLDARPERVEAACDASLRRLGTDVIDLFYLHRVDPNVAIEDTYGAMARLVEKGKVRALGLCEVGPRTYARAAAIHPVAVVQSEYSLWSREPETDIIPTLRQHGTWFFGYASLGRGILSGNLKSPADLPAGDQRRDMPRFQGENFYKNLELVDLLKQLAAEAKVNAAQLALAWCRRHGEASPIVGATEPQHVRDAQVAASLEIPASVWQKLDEVFSPDAVAGQRYPESAMKRLESGR
ncbi:aldo/keto reductase [Bordetella genomosp. 9]|uniref:Aldo/keto reductase n=1 Tax=Bordetella genomosp. 9 TaxID=1416803 RepID=A0A261RMY4_9BORD|nr:aldo/keto reductase [Bordetella genomosp. 9]OZI26261.1 aldo/keto reductase [Bordetella genomosp. 9]